MRCERQNDTHDKRRSMLNKITLTDICCARYISLYLSSGSEVAWFYLHRKLMYYEIGIPMSVAAAWIGGRSAILSLQAARLPGLGSGSEVTLKPLVPSLSGREP
ncbi:hypothetical protein J6590_096298 [Homalodisca vitripennis]|nr:hypothetical protein J6590_096298 [Homalodisca vitripennis]